MPDIQHKRGTRAALDALAASDNLLPAQIYLISDEGRIAIATSSNTYVTYVKESEQWFGTAAAYAAIPSPNPKTTYFVTG